MNELLNEIKTLKEILDSLTEITKSINSLNEKVCNKSKKAIIKFEEQEKNLYENNKHFIR